MNQLQKDWQNFQGTPLDTILQICLTLALLWFGIKWTFGKKDTQGKRLLGAFILVFASANIMRTSSRWTAWESQAVSWLNSVSGNGG